jgi:hypothetical protein
MWKSILNALFDCAHRRTTFPITCCRTVGQIGSRTETYVVCLDCGTEFAYDWAKMKRKDAVTSALPNLPERVVRT